MPWITFVCDRLPRIENSLQKDRPEIFRCNPQTVEVRIGRRMGISSLFPAFGEAKPSDVQTRQCMPDCKSTKTIEKIEPGVCSQNLVPENRVFCSWYRIYAQSGKNSTSEIPLGNFVNGIDEGTGAQIRIMSAGGFMDFVIGTDHCVL